MTGDATFRLKHVTNVGAVDAGPRRAGEGD